MNPYWTGLQILAAREADPPVPWKQLELEHGMTRSYLARLCRLVRRSTVPIEAPIGANLVETARLLELAYGPEPACIHQVHIAAVDPVTGDTVRAEISSS